MRRGGSDRGQRVERPTGWTSHGDLDCDGIDDLEWFELWVHTNTFSVQRTAIVFGAATGTLSEDGGALFRPTTFVNLDDSCSVEIFGLEPVHDFIGFFGWRPEVRDFVSIIAEEPYLYGTPSNPFPITVWEDANCDAYHDVAFVAGGLPTWPGEMYYGGPSDLGVFGFHPLFARYPDPGPGPGPRIFASGNQLVERSNLIATYPNPIVQVVHADLAWPGAAYAVTETCPTCVGTVHLLTSPTDQGLPTEQLAIQTSTGAPQYYGVFSIAGRIDGEELLAFVRPSSTNNVFGVIEVRRFDPTSSSVFLPGVYEVAPVAPNDGYGQPRFVEQAGVPGIAAYSRETGRYQFHAWVDATTGFSPVVTHTY